LFTNQAADAELLGDELINYRWSANNAISITRLNDIVYNFLISRNIYQEKTVEDNCSLKIDEKTTGNLRNKLGHLPRNTPEEVTQRRMTRSAK
jgi:hypothetical protein